MESSTDMKFGVIVVDEYSEFASENLSTLSSILQNLGCSSDKIVIKHVPTLHDSVIATQFMAQYTDVDGVIILAPKLVFMDTLPLMNGIIQIQIQWTMVVEIGGYECANNIVTMIDMQNEMEIEATDCRGQHSELC
jgi:6,7-dimethyl-8-ribityllumazine synthase